MSVMYPKLIRERVLRYPCGGLSQTQDRVKGNPPRMGQEGLKDLDTLSKVCVDQLLFSKV